MKQYAIIKGNEITQTILCREEEIHYYDGEAIECTSDISPSTHYYDGEFKLMPENTNPYSVFDYRLGIWVDQRTDEELNQYVLSVVRSKRDKLLKESDWTQVADAPVDKVACAEYRQQLRDLPQTYANATNIEQVQYPAQPW